MEHHWDPNASFHSQSQPQYPHNRRTKHNLIVLLLFQFPLYLKPIIHSFAPLFSFYSPTILTTNPPSRFSSRHTVDCPHIEAAENLMFRSVDRGTAPPFLRWPERRSQGGPVWLLRLRQGGRFGCFGWGQGWGRHLGRGIRGVCGSWCLTEAMLSTGGGGEVAVRWRKRGWWRWGRWGAAAVLCSL